MSKGALVIGVDKTGGLPRLKSAATGAAGVAKWLRAEGFDEVKLLTDLDGARVGARAVEDALEEMVTDLPQYELLLVYFSGHGFFHSRSDHWMLSGAPRKASDAINLQGAMDAAKFSAIKTVVFLSDSCRVTPTDRPGWRVEGVPGFPTLEQVDRVSKVDVISATVEGAAAWEVPVVSNDDGATETWSLLTQAWRAAYREPSSDMVLEVAHEGETISVVPNRKLEVFVQNRIRHLLSEAKKLVGAGELELPADQRIDANVPSDDDVYIARVDQMSVPVDPPAVAKLRATRTAFVIDPARYIKANAMDGEESRRFAAHKPTIETRLSYESNCGFVLPNALVERIAFSGEGVAGRGAEVPPDSRDYPDAPNVEYWEHPDHAGTTLIRAWTNQTYNNPVSIAVKVSDGRSFVVPAVPGRIGHIALGPIGVDSVNFVPSRHDYRWDFYEPYRDRLDDVRALAAMATDDGRFHVHDAADAKALADTVRMLKAVDPTLGLYAAYAYSEAGREDQVADVHEYMANDQAPLFDVGMLASRVTPQATNVMVPFCPMLTQGWNLLRPRGIKLRSPLSKAQRHLVDSLWTTFRAEFSDVVLDATENGKFL